MRVTRRLSAVVVIVGLSMLSLPVAGASTSSASETRRSPVVARAPGDQPVPNHTTLVPSTPRNNTPRISNGEIWDIAVVGDRVFIAGSFTSIANTVGDTTPLSQRYLAAYNIDTGLIDRSFRPTFDGGVNAVESSPDGKKLYVGGTFHSISGVTRSKVARLDLTTGKPTAGFATTGVTDNAVSALAASDTTLYVGGRFNRINGQLRTGLAALNGTTGVVDMAFDNQLSGGIGVGGMLTVKQLKLTHDNAKLLVVHTGRKIDGQDRLGVGIINTTTKQLLPWRTRLWDQYLPVVGGVTRIYAGDISPDDSYFVVTSGSGGDRPPISDTAVAFPIKGQDLVQPLWVARCFDSVYSVAITEKAVYIGGHFGWNESPTANQPWPGLDNVGYGTGQGLSGYGLGDQVVRRHHLGALDPATGTALEWNPRSDSFEGDKAMLATPRGLFVGGDGQTKGDVNTGRVAFFDLATVPSPAKTNTTITQPIEGHVVPAGTQFSLKGRAKSTAGVKQVNVSVQRFGTQQYLQDNLTTWGGANTITASLGGKANRNSRPWSLTLNLTGTRDLDVHATTVAKNGNADRTPARRTMEIFSFDDQTPSTTVLGPSSPQPSTSFTMTGTATDDHGVSALNYWFRDEAGQYLQDDGTVGALFNTFRGLPDVVGATSATWSYDVALPHEGTWRGSATAIDTAGQSDLRSSTRDWLISSSTSPPVVSVQKPVPMTPPSLTPSVTVAPGSPITFSGTALDPDGLRDVEVTLKNSSTKENLASDGTWGVGAQAGYYRVSPLDISGKTYGWSYTTPFNLSPGIYSFSIRATDDLGLTTSTTNRGTVSVVAQVPGNDFPDVAITNPGVGNPPLPSSHLVVTGTATDDTGVSSVMATVYDQDSGRYLQTNNTLTSGYATRAAVLGSPGATNTTWTLDLTLPEAGDFIVTARAIDSAGQLDDTLLGATGRYLYFPGDAPPTFVDSLGQPVDGSPFTVGRIQVSGRAEDDKRIAKVEVAVIDASGNYLSSLGTFTPTVSWRPTFLNSPGSLGSNFSYTTPVIPDGTYTVLARPIDDHDQIGTVRTASNVTVTHPVNNPPIAHATVSCAVNLCTFDGRTSTDEDPSSLTYSWDFTNGQGLATGGLRTKQFTAPGLYNVVLTVTDEWNTSATTTVPVTISTPAGNHVPVPTMLTNCSGLTCGVTAAGTTDPDNGDVITYSWNWGDGSPVGSGLGTSHAYGAAGTYLVTLTATDGWGASASTSASVTVP